jgi:hypothetical protein
MFHPLNLSNRFVALLGLSLLILPVVLVNTNPLNAHEVQTSGNVGGTKHIEPNDNPLLGLELTHW